MSRLVGINETRLLAPRAGGRASARDAGGGKGGLSLLGTREAQSRPVVFRGLPMIQHSPQNASAVFAELPTGGSKILARTMTEASDQNDRVSAPAKGSRL